MSGIVQRLREWADQWPEDSNNFKTPMRLYEGADALEKAESRVKEIGGPSPDAGLVGMGLGQFYGDEEA